MDLAFPINLLSRPSCIAAGALLGMLKLPQCRPPFLYSGREHCLAARAEVRRAAEGQVIAELHGPWVLVPTQGHRGVRRVP